MKVPATLKNLLHFFALAFGIILTVLLLTGCTNTKLTNETAQTKIENQNAPEQKNDKDQKSNTPGTYKTYSEDIVKAEQQAGNKVVLFFHASWCPFCKAADTAFKARASEIPSGVTILKTDYDTSNELKKKYGITYQHTFVQIDANGNALSKWTSGDIDNLVKFLK